MADFTATVTSGCSPLNVTFTDQSTGSPLSWYWDFGSPVGLRQGKSVSVSFPAGTYTVTLTVMNADGVNSITKTDYVVANPSPSVNFSADKTLVCLPAAVNFQDLSTANAGDLISWKWDFGDGVQDISGPTPQHAYTLEGYYNVNLTVTSSSGCKSTSGKSRYIRVVNGVKADFNYTGPSTCDPPFAIDFANLTSGPGNLTYNWDLGNGSNSAQLSPSGTYTAAGSYPVTLTATSDFGCSDVIQKTIPVTGKATSFETAGNKDSVCLGSPFNFQSTTLPAPDSITWNFGDGSTFSGTTPPAKTYAVAGSYTVTMNAYFANCASVATKTVKVFDKPVVDFSAPKTNSCKGPLTVNFQNLSPDVATAAWTFGEGGTGADVSPTYTYGAASNGNFDVGLTITDSKGCVNTITKPQYIQILPPSIDIINLPGGGCANKPFTATPSIGAVDGIASTTWDFGDGSPVSTSPTHTYDSTGFYTLTLTVTTNDGCTATVTKPNAVQIGTPPMVDFSASPIPVCHSSVVIFTDLSTPVNTLPTPPNPVVWSFSDGTTSILPQPSHKFRDSGFYTIKLKVTNNGCADSTVKTNFVHVLPPVAKFGYKVDCTTKKDVSFTDSSENNAAVYGALSYSWDFGDGSPLNLSANPTHTFSTIDVYKVRLVVNNNNNCPDTVNKIIQLVNDTADFTVSKDTVCRNVNVVFTSINTPAYFKKYQWLIDGASHITTVNTYGTPFTTPGGHSIQLVATDVNGCTDTSTVHIVFVTGPTALFGVGNNGGCKNSTIIFTDSSKPAGTIQTWVFDFGDGTPYQTYTAPPFSHNYADTGSYIAYMTVYDNKGCQDTYKLPARVKITKPFAKFGAPNTVFCPGTPLQFNDSSTGKSLSYKWDFGDGVSGTGKTTLHSYPAGDGVYSVKLVITDSVGCADSLTRSNYINIKGPKPTYTVKDTVTLCPPLETKFTFTGKDYQSFTWDFGDGASYSKVSTSHFYDAYGKYIAKLYVTGFGGCVDSASIPINVTDPYANTAYTFDPKPACNQLTVNFAVKTPNGTAFAMFFGDGTSTPFSATTQDTAFSHFYGSPNIYAPYVFLKDNTGCQVQVGGRGSVNVKGAIPIFGLDKNKFCDSSLVYFTNYSQQGNDPIVKRIWDFNDGSAAVTLPGDATHDYTKPGLYAPTLTITTAANCTQKFTDTVRVFATPSPVITSANAVCNDLFIDLAGSLAVPPDTAITWLWTPGNGQTYGQQNLSIKYADTGVHHIMLQATNKLGCHGQTSKDIVVNPLPSIKITGDTTMIAGGAGITIPLTYSSNAASFSWTPSTYLSCTDCPNPFAIPKFTTTYKVTVTDENGCVSSRNLTLLVVCNNKNFFIPNTFSPNNDGSNDRFYPRGTGLNLIAALRIFNRWGELVFEKRNFPANDASSGWDGMYKGKTAATDTYIYMIDIICDNANIITYKGNVTLIR